MYFCTAWISLFCSFKLSLTSLAEKSKKKLTLCCEESNEKKTVGESFNFGLGMIKNKEQVFEKLLV